MNIFRQVRQVSVRVFGTMPSVCLSFAVLQILVRCIGSTTFNQNLTDGSENHENRSNIEDLMSPAGKTPLPVHQVN